MTEPVFRHVEVISLKQEQKSLYLTRVDLIAAELHTWSWQVKKNGVGISILGSDSSIVAELPKENGSDDSVRKAYVIAAAPLLLDVCAQLRSVLENNLIVTSDGFKINCSEVRTHLLEAILRATGCRKYPEEP